MSDQDPWAGLAEGFAPPQANGELIFEAPWQGRAFGMAHSLVDAGRFSWDEFREQLITALDNGCAEADDYYRCFLLALERTLAQNNLCDSATLGQRVDQFAARPADHDH